MFVRVHRNLHKNQFNISTYVKGRGWRLYKYADKCILKDVKFVVNQGGRRRVLREGKKNVHAFLFGTLLDVESNKYEHLFRTQVTYNPYNYHTFIDPATHWSIYSAGTVVCKDGKVFI